MHIIVFLKHLFIPHQGNNYKPHFFREHVILSILIGSIFLLLISFTSYTVLRTTKFGTTVIASVLVDLTNETRKKNNLPPLLYNLKLKEAAEFKGEDMNTKQYFSHFAPDGTSPWHWFEKAGYSYTHAGENLAINFTNSREVEMAWLSSKKHRENILSKDYEDIGIATVQGTVATTPVLFIIQMFGKSSSAEHNESPHHVKWYELLLFNGPEYIAKIYSVLITILIGALLTMILIEIKKQHVLHILYGILLIVSVFIFIAINSLFF